MGDNNTAGEYSSYYMVAAWMNGAVDKNISKAASDLILRNLMYNIIYYGKDCELEIIIQQINIPHIIWWPRG